MRELIMRILDMDEAKTKQRIDEIICDTLGRGKLDLRPETLLVEELEFSELDEAELLMAIEEDFEQEMTDEESGGIVTIQNAYDLAIMYSRR